MVICSKQGIIAWYLLPSLNWNLVHIYKGWKLTHCKFTIWLFTSIRKCVVLCMLSSYPSWTYIWFWSFTLALNTLEQYLQQYFKKWGNRVKFWWWEFILVGHQSGREAGTLPSIGGGKYSGGLIPLCILWKNGGPFLKSVKNLPSFCTFFSFSPCLLSYLALFWLYIAPFFEKSHPCPHVLE